MLRAYHAHIGVLALTGDAVVDSLRVRIELLPGLSSGSPSAGGGVDSEDIEVLEVPFGEALTMITKGTIKDGKTIMLLYHARIENLLVV